MKLNKNKQRPGITLEQGLTRKLTIIVEQLYFKWCNRNICFVDVNLFLQLTKTRTHSIDNTIRTYNIEHKFVIYLILLNVNELYVGCTARKQKQSNFLRFLFYGFIRSQFGMILVLKFIWKYKYR